MRPATVFGAALICASIAHASGARAEETAAPAESGSGSLLQPFRASPRDVLLSGVFEAAARDWILLCDHPQLSVGFWNDHENLHVRAIVWNDGDDTTGPGVGRELEVGDYSVLQFHFGEGAAREAGDLNVVLNPWPHMKGPFLTRQLSEQSTSRLQELPGALASIRYAHDIMGKKVRTETYNLPLSELGLQPGASFRLSFYAHSAVPLFATSCASGFQRGRFYPHAIPVTRYRQVTLHLEEGESLSQ